MDAAHLPKLNLAEWEDTRLYLQLVCQIVGKTRLRLHPPLNHWWHVPLYPSARGLTTGGIPYRGDELEIGVDLYSHVMRLTRGELSLEVPLGDAMCDVYAAYREALRELEVEVKLIAVPYGCKSTTPFVDDHEHRLYDPEAAHRAWKVLAQVDAVFKEFRGRFLGKCSPVHMFWHSFDLACTRFSGEPAPPMEGVDRVTQEAYSHEVVSAGFWFGDDSVPEAAFYCYAAPSPTGLADTPLSPSTAEWMMLRGSPMALLRYEDIRQSSDPHGDVLQFLQSSYEAGANLANWDRAKLERP